MKKKLVIALTLLVLLSTYKPQKLLLIKRLNIKEIKIENNFIIRDQEIKNNLDFLYQTNLFILKTKRIENILKKIDFIESFEVKKKYPNKLVIKIFEKKPIAVLQSEDIFFYISEKFELINYRNLSSAENLPTVVGDKDSFKKLYSDLKEINFPFKLIKRYYLHETQRWDIETYKKILIKLPSQNYIQSLKNFMIIIENQNYQQFKVYDYRISKQLILK